MISFQSFVLIIHCTASATIELTGDNWRQILEGEWFIKLYADYCPACNSLWYDWVNLDNVGPQYGFKTGQIDIQSESKLVVRFMVSSIPKIYHVIDGQFRLYSGQRDSDSMIDYIITKKWKNDTKVGYFISPNTIFMDAFTLVASGFEVLENFHSQYLSDYCQFYIFSFVVTFIGFLFLLVVFNKVSLLLSRSVDYVDEKEEDEEVVNDDDFEIIDSN